MLRIAKVAVVLGLALLVGLPMLNRLTRESPEVPSDAAPNELRAPAPGSGAPGRAAENRGPAIITQPQAQQIRTGMTYEECIRIIGCEGDPPASRTGGPPASAYSEAYMWHFPGLDKTKTIYFRDGRVMGTGTASSPSHNARARTMQGSRPTRQTARRSGTPPYISMDTYMKIKSGMTYKECVKVLGAEGTYAGRQPSAGGTYDANGRPIRLQLDTYTWANPHDSTHATIQFRDGKVAARTFGMNAGAAGGGVGRGGY